MVEVKREGSPLRVHRKKTLGLGGPGPERAQVVVHLKGKVLRTSSRDIMALHRTWRCGLYQRHYSLPSVS